MDTLNDIRTQPLGPEEELTMLRLEVGRLRRDRDGWRRKYMELRAEADALLVATRARDLVAAADEAICEQRWTLAGDPDE